MLSFDRYCDEIVTQTSLLTSAITGADLTVQVPRLPGLERRPAAAAPRRHAALGRRDRAQPGHRAGPARLHRPVTDLLLVLYRRRPAAAVEVLGDAGLLDLWLDRVKFG